MYILREKKLNFLPIILLTINLKNKFKLVGLEKWLLFTSSIEVRESDSHFLFLNFFNSKKENIIDLISTECVLDYYRYNFINKLQRLQL